MIGNRSKFRDSKDKNELCLMKTKSPFPNIAKQWSPPHLKSILCLNSTSIQFIQPTKVDLNHLNEYSTENKSTDPIEKQMRMDWSTKSSWLQSNWFYSIQCFPFSTVMSSSTCIIQLEIKSEKKMMKENNHRPTDNKHIIMFSYLW